MHRDDLVRYLNDFLAIDRGSDYGPNGLQVEGRAEICRVVTGVSACQELFERALELQADAVLVHHGLFWSWDAPVLTGLLGRRVRTLVRADLNLLGYHLPLDRHPEVGNNAVAARTFGLIDLEPFAPHDGVPVGFCGRFPEPLPADLLARRTAEIFGQTPVAFLAGPDPVGSLGLVSGGAQKDFYAAIERGLDAYITGEVSEWVMNVARECRTHFLAAGHYATERLGILALGEHLASRFSLEVEFVDVPNPV